MRIEPGNTIMIILAAANRDPDRFENPDRLDLRRVNNPHLAFGGGPHFCIGNQLARLQGQTSILRMVQKFPGMQLTNQAPSRGSQITRFGGLRLFRFISDYCFGSMASSSTMQMSLFWACWANHAQQAVLPKQLIPIKTSSIRIGSLAAKDQSRGLTC